MSIEPGGAVKIYNNDDLKLQTYAGGVQHIHDVWFDSDTTAGRDAFWDSSESIFRLYDLATLALGNDNDLKLYHYDGHNYIHSDTGDLNICVDTGAKVVVQSGSSGNHLAEFNFEGSVELFYNGHKALNTTADGIQVYGSDNSNCIIQLNSDLSTNYSDKYRLKLDDGGPFYIQNYNSGSWVTTFTILNTGKTQVHADASTAYAFEVYNDGSSFNRYGVKVQCGQDSPSSNWNWPMAFNDGDGTNVGNIKFNSTSGLIYDPFTAAHHCIVPDDDNPSDSSMAYPYGTLLETTEVVNIDRGLQYKVQKTQTANSRKVLGVYGGSMNGGPNGDTNLHDVLVLGDGHILVNNAGGNIEVGDGICSSATAGIGQKATANPSMIIGIAQEAITFTGSETKLVAVQYGLQQFIPWT